ncbi:hypothetical protein LJR220_003388 [Bradyrhizobium sp. LjRoot220]|uniref:hypothetical protein n=1 Tax=Bradyrhizobium sp. LjRoot220 TaxID=3342284 RepID=UPI003ECFD9E5
MIADLYASAIANPKPFFVGLFFGSVGFGGALGVIGWCIGYDVAMRTVNSWMRPKNRDPETFGEVPTLPPQRDRRHIPTTPGRFV